MCLIVFAHRVHADYPLVLAANRDEFYDRPATRLAWWQDEPEVLAGRDTRGGGSWLGLARDGRFAAITNVREPGRTIASAPSRGALVADFLRHRQSADDYLHTIDGDDYNGFNLLAGTPADDPSLGVKLYYLSNRVTTSYQPVSPGLYGLSNDTLNTPWPKVERARTALARTLRTREIDVAAIFELLSDSVQARDADLPSTGLPLASERALSSVFITTPHYGTRVSTVVVMRSDGLVSVEERAFTPTGPPVQESFQR